MPKIKKKSEESTASTPPTKISVKPNASLMILEAVRNVPLKQVSGATIKKYISENHGINVMDHLATSRVLTRSAVKLGEKNGSESNLKVEKGGKRS